MSGWRKTSPPQPNCQPSPGERQGKPARLWCVRSSVSVELFLVRKSIEALLFTRASSGWGADPPPGWTMDTRPLVGPWTSLLVDKGRNDVVEIERPHKVIHLLTQLIASEMVKVCVKIVHFSPFAGRSTAKMIHHV